MGQNNGNNRAHAQRRDCRDNTKEKAEEKKREALASSVASRQCDGSGAALALGLWHAIGFGAFAEHMGVSFLSAQYER